MTTQENRNKILTKAMELTEDINTIARAVEDTFDNIEYQEGNKDNMTILINLSYQLYKHIKVGRQQVIKDSDLDIMLGE